MRTFIVYESVNDKTGSLKMYPKENLLSLLKDLGATTFHDWTTEEEAIKNMSSIEGGWNGDGDKYWMIGEVITIFTCRDGIKLDFKMLIE